MNAPVFDNSYARLPQRMFAPVRPMGSPDPQLLALNAPLAQRLGLDPDWLAGPEGLAMLSGNALPPGAAGIAQAYAGQQFGHLVPQLGDGRALMIGEVVAPDGARFDLQLKGSGPTPFSRQGDGLSWLGPVLREYLVSEFMAAAGVPTTRALAAVATGGIVRRESRLPGAILTRVASSHIRVGTFEYFALRGDCEALRALTEHAGTRHFPQAETPAEFLSAVVAAQARLIALWMGLGFVHGVMNTDNMAVSGETIDYGPCAFLDEYQPDKVFSSIDRGGRYAYDQQPHVAVWNLAQLASCLIPLLDEDEDAAVAEATRIVHAYPQLFEVERDRVFAAKLGLQPSDTARNLVARLLEQMAEEAADFTRVFAGLSDGSARAQFRDTARFDVWEQDWRAAAPEQDIMSRANPRRIPRNHRIEAAIAAAVGGDTAPFDRLRAALSDPFADREEWDDLAAAPLASERVTRTFCGT
ncbi:protein adenylyltransferase SelO [Paracoccus jeotgali]|uniref:Protein nucleotidyltransferase YdiU n=1 Tax=Paracoccus jeotgali TaxID=2065379 RepID=A0A2K9MES1_9RHOB|nr:YdiU family protein [Paracoccus jeotgali]AUM74120.1 YdiU family protein [Paracoccus jeotgali]